MSDPPAEIGQLLAQLGEAGDWHSQGTFTWDWERARKLLQLRQLPKNSEYILRFVATAVASGAREFSVEELGYAGYRLSWDSPPPGLELFGAQAESSVLSDLAVGIGAASQIYTEVEVLLQDFVLTLSAKGLEIRPHSEKEGRTVVNLVSRGWRGWLRRFGRGCEVSLLSERCAYSDLSWLLPSSAVPVRFPCDDQAAILFGDVPSWPGNVLAHYEEHDPKLGRGIFIPEHRCRLSTLIHLGVTYPLDKSFLPGPGRLLWWHDSLRLDLSRSHLVKGSDFFNWREQVREHVVLALEDSLSSDSTNPILLAYRHWYNFRRTSQRQSDTELERLQKYLTLARQWQESLQQGRYKEALEIAEGAAKLN